MPREAVATAMREPDKKTLLSAGLWNQRWHSQRRFGDRVLHVIWAQRDEGVLVFTTWWKSTPEKGDDPRDKVRSNYDHQCIHGAG